MVKHFGEVNIRVFWKNRVELQMKFNNGKIVSMYSYKRKKKSPALKKLLRQCRRRF